MTVTTDTATTPDGPMSLTVARPAGDATRGVVVVQEAFGVNEHIADVAGRLAEVGYLAVAPHLYHRTGDPVVGYTEYQKLGPHMGVLTEQGLLDDVDAALGFLADSGVAASRAGIVGFCMGGTVTFLTAVRRRIGAAVTFYDGGVGQGRFGLPPLVDLTPGLSTPWLGLYGDKDPSISVDDVEALRAGAARAAVPTEIVRYADAGHGFHCDARADYHEPSATDAWARALAWFDTYLGA